MVDHQGRPGSGAVCLTAEILTAEILTAEILTAEIEHEVELSILGCFCNWTLKVGAGRLGL
jgi:hypothetical protein